MSGVHGGRAQGACDRPPAGRGGAAQGRAEDAAGRHPQQVRIDCLLMFGVQRL